MSRIISRPTLRLRGTSIGRGRQDRLIIFDADDTLWYLEPLYDHARAHARHLVEAAGLDGAEWERLERELDVINVAQFGLSPVRFPTSCVQAYQLLTSPSDSRIEESIWAAASAVFMQRAPLVPDASLALTLLKPVAPLALLTKGDTWVQQKRLADSGLEKCFDAIFIVADKDEQAFQTVLSHFSCAPQHAWSVGNSVKSDIKPALDLGMKAVWIDAHVWEHERSSLVAHSSVEFLRADNLLMAARMIYKTILSHPRKVATNQQVAYPRRTE